MPVIKPSQSEVEELVSKQIQVFKNVVPMDDRHLRVSPAVLPHHGALSGNGSNRYPANAGTGVIVRGLMAYFYVKKCSCGKQLRVKETSSLQPGFSLGESFLVPCDYCGEIHRELSNLEVVELAPETSGAVSCNG